jgi:PAS domain S-box-containing protein
VIQFNPDCERLTGFSRAEVLNKGIQQLIPLESQSEWEALFSDMKANLRNTSFDLPVQTRSKEQVMVSWNAFLVTDSNATLQSICLIAEAQRLMEPSKAVAQIPTSVPCPSQPALPSETAVVATPATEQRNDVDTTSRSVESLQEDLRSIQKMLASMNTVLESLTKTMNSSQAVLDQLPGELHTMADGIQELRFKTHERIPVEKPAEEPSLHSRFGFHKTVKTTQTTDAVQLRNEELEYREQQLRQKEQELNLRYDEFCLWKDKLKAIEENIERRQALLESEPNSPPVQRELDHDDAQTQDYLSALAEGAVIIQRGIIKKANTLFASLVGYDVQELVEKSLFDFIALEGLGRIEQYYLDRLKGESLDGYSTVFLKKDHTPVSVDVQIKTIRCNGETAEVLLVNPPQTQ